MSARGIEEIENGVLDALGIEDGMLDALNEASIAVIKLTLMNDFSIKKATNCLIASMLKLFRLNSTVIYPYHLSSPSPPVTACAIPRSLTF